MIQRQITHQNIVQVIDFNPTVMRELRRRGIKVIYGDIAHADTLHHAHIEDAALVVSSITDDILRGTSNLRILHTVKRVSPICTWARPQTFPICLLIQVAAASLSSGPL